jgi:L-2-hydroxycarboxylate dehydrogenase (NAD+)
MQDVPITSLRTTLVSVLSSLGHGPAEAGVIADVIMYAELRGNNQGVVKLVAGALSRSPSQGEVQVSYETGLSARIDGAQNIGMVVVGKCVDMAMEKAKATGIGIVGCSGYSSATGALGYWARKISENNLISIVMSQCPEMVAPHGSYEPIFGTNPLAIGIPTPGRPQVLDMATSASAWYGLAMAKEAGKSIPSDIAYDNSGQPTTDPSEAMKGALRVFDRSFKGSHLALMVELLAGAWTGASMSNKHGEKNWGSLVMAIDPKILGPIEEFQEKAAEMCSRVKNAKTLPDFDQSIYLPGERGDEQEAESLSKGTIPISEVIYSKLLNMLPKTENP